uniref:Ufm1-specific protease 1-like n=1 Tax=Phallusia mammillata TaxID=59560 RepID=A0A6F9DVP6_9ASCI|nr:ufm1-specific protease 1-like [Phallusia mammillata]
MIANEFSCPFCCYLSPNSEELQTHVSSEHYKELKTPTKSGKKQQSHESDESFTECPICMTYFSIKEIDNHVQKHLSEAEPSCSTEHDALVATCLHNTERMVEENLAKEAAENLQLQLLQEEFNCDPNDKVTYKKQAKQVMEKAVGRKKMTTTEYYRRRFEMLESLEQGIDDGSTLTPDFAFKLSKLFNQNTRNNTSIILNSTSVHYGRGAGDSGWGCGFRNLQMMISSLAALPAYRDHLQQFQDKIPSIPKLQSLIEDAWAIGFDPRGREQLMGKLVGTRKWIGATEAFVLLSSLHLHCKIVDFHSRSGSKVNTELFKWVLKYFQKDLNQESLLKPGSVELANIPILYLQHHGHSRSVCGVQVNMKTKAASHLIVCDPGMTKHQLSAALNGNKTCSLSKTLNSFKEEKYQVVAVVGISTTEQFERQKDVDTLAEKIYSQKT